MQLRQTVERENVSSLEKTTRHPVDLGLDRTLRSLRVNH